MSTTDLDQAIGKLSSILSTPHGVPANSEAPTAPPPATAAPSSPPAAGISPSTLTDAQKDEIAAFVYASMSLPPISRVDRIEMEKGLPALVDTFGGLHATPTLHADYLDILDYAFSQTTTVERDSPNTAVVDFAQSLQRDAFGDSNERILPLIGLGVACFMAGYTIVHNWKT